MDVLRASGVEIAYERLGSGPPLVLVHGAVVDHRMWQPQYALADAFTVIAWDEPGCGRSSDPSPDAGLGEYAAALAALIETVGPAHVCGLSWGSTVVLELYRQRPDLVASLIFSGGYAGWMGSLPAEEVAVRIAGARAMLAAPPEEFDPTLPGLFAADPPADVVALMEEMNADVRPASVARALEIMAETDLSDVLPTIAVPTLLLWGELDVRSPLPVAQQFAAAIPHADLVTLPGAGHVSNLERPEAFNAALRAFLAEHAL